MKRYTAKDMREMALVEESYGWDVVAKMLRQAADMMEREEKRERRYEYKLKKKRQNGVATQIIVRREVGEWEDVRDETEKDC